MSFRQSHIHQFHIFSLNVNGSGGISPPGRLSDLRTSGFPDLCFTRTLSHLCVDAVNWFDQLPLLKISQSREAMIESCHVILNENTVMDDGYVRGCRQSPALIEERKAEENIVRLPFTRFPAGVYERNILLVNTRRLASPTPVCWRTGRFFCRQKLSNQPMIERR
jgi:hypothetical protein